MNNKTLLGKIALVTGSSSSIGETILKALANVGAKVILTYNSKDPLEKKNSLRIINDLTKKDIFLQEIALDLSSRNSIYEMYNIIQNKYDKLDILINNAATFHHKIPLLDLDENEWDRVMNVNLKGTFLCIKHAAKLMIKNKIKGKIINISSVGADKIFSNMGAYATSKGAINTLTKVMAVELAYYGINVNAISPGHINTKMNQEYLSEIPSRRKSMLSKIPISRLGEQHEIAHTVLYLIGNDFITGQIIRVDGGLSIWQGPD